jgi:2-desacetyl-2-hydroxyethyl bacteriochlorophyllide A dehydrogenase
MQALRFRGPDDICVEEMPRPQTGPGEVLVRVAYAGICATDLEILAGIHLALLSGASAYPMTPGHEWSGTVVEVGDGVTHLTAGDLVVGETGIGCFRCPLCLSGHHQLCPQGTETGIVRRDGAMREYHVQDARFVHRFPVADAQAAALVEPASVGLYAAVKASVSPLDRVAVVGGGTIGQFCLQGARACGARTVLMVSRSAPKLRLAERLGADRAISSAEVDLSAVAREVTQGDLFDVVIEAAGTEGAFNDALHLGGYTSRIAMVGLSAQEPYGYNLATIIDREQQIIGVRGSPHTYPQTIELIGQGRIQTKPLVSQVFPLADYAEAFAAARSGRPDVMKVLLEIGA